MALTEAEEKALKDGLAAANTAIAGLQTSLAEKDTKIVALEKGQIVSEEDRAIAGLRTKFPTVPESTLRALPAASREVEAGKLHESLSKVAPATDPLKAWSRVGSVMPSLDAETEAEKLATAQAKDKAMKEGNSGGVMQAKTKEIARFVLSSILPR